VIIAMVIAIAQSSVVQNTGGQDINELNGWIKNELYGIL
jgi:hypothetical protein